MNTDYRIVDHARSDLINAVEWYAAALRGWLDGEPNPKQQIAWDLRRTCETAIEEALGVLAE